MNNSATCLVSTRVCTYILLVSESTSLRVSMVSCLFRGVSNLSTHPRALRALRTRDKSDTPLIDVIQIERIHINKKG